MPTLRTPLALFALLVSCKASVHRQDPLPAETDTVGETVYRLVKVFDRIDGARDDKSYALIVPVGPYSFSGPGEPILVELKRRPSVSEGACFTSPSPRGDLKWTERECPVFPNRTGIPFAPFL